MDSISPPVGNPALTTIHEAFSNFVAEIYPSDVRFLRSITLEDVRKAIKIIERDHEQRRCSRNLRRIEPILQALGKFGTAIDVLCQGTPYLSFVWAPLKLLLQIANESIDGFYKLIDAYAEIARHLPRFDRFGKAFADHETFQSTLAEVYSDILEFHRHAYKSLRRSGWKIAFDACWKSFEGRFNAILQRLARNQDLIDKEANSFDILEAKEWRRKMLEDLKIREVERRQWQLRDTITWLDLKGQDTEQDDLFQQRSKARHENTCDWILKNTTIRLWLDLDDHRRFFWLKGKPGSGKTTLAVHLTNMAPVPPTSLVLYCLCSYGYGKPEGKVCNLTFRSLIAQIIRARPDLLPYVYDTYVAIAPTPSLAKTSDLLRNLLTSMDTTWLILDGLDECDGNDQKQLMTELNNLTFEDSEQPKLKVLVCSRDTKDTPKILTKLARPAQISLAIEQESVSQDIAKYTRSRLSELEERFNKQLLEEIGTEIAEKADGMFLWVHLVLAIVIEKRSVKELRTAVSHLPRSLPEVYKSILHRMQELLDESQLKQANLILSYLAFAFRPLKSWEICSMLVFQDQDDVLDDDTELDKGILDICKPLIEEREQDIVALAHYSVKEFLLHRASGPYLNTSISHINITAACLRYLLTCHGFTTSTISINTYRSIVKGFHDIFPYVQEFWPNHLKKCFELHTMAIDDTRLRKLLQELDHFACHSQIAQAANPNLQMEEPDPVHANVLLQSSSTRSLEMTIPKSLQEYLDFRILLTNKTTQIEIGIADAARDPTLLSSIYDRFRITFESILHESRLSKCNEIGVTREKLEEFLRRHSNAAYCCRRIGCPRASTGFRTSAERAKHETDHKMQFRCPEQKCEFANHGFASREGLRKHLKSYHVKEEDTVLPKLHTPRTIIICPHCHGVGFEPDLYPHCQHCLSYLGNSFEVDFSKSQPESRCTVCSTVNSFPRRCTRCLGKKTVIEEEIFPAMQESDSQSAKVNSPEQKMALTPFTTALTAGNEQTAHLSPSNSSQLLEQPSLDDAGDGANGQLSVIQLRDSYLGEWLSEHSSVEIHDRASKLTFEQMAYMDLQLVSQNTLSRGGFHPQDVDFMNRRILQVYGTSGINWVQLKCLIGRYPHPGISINRLIGLQETLYAEFITRVSKVGSQFTLV